MHRQSETHDYEQTKLLIESLADAYVALKDAKKELGDFNYKHCDMQLRQMIEELLIKMRTSDWLYEDDSDDVD